MSSINDIPDGWSEKILVDCLDSLIDYRGKTPKKIRLWYFNIKC